MNKMIQKMMAVLMMLVMLCGAACAETVEDYTVDPGNRPERGLIFPLTQEDVEVLGMGTGFFMGTMEGIAELPVATVNFTDYESVQKILEIATQEAENDPDKAMEYIFAMFDQNHTIYSIVLFEKAYYEAQLAAGKTADDLMGAEGVKVIGENDGYVYVGADDYDTVMAKMETETQKAAAEKAFARCEELVANLSFQPIVFAEGEFTEVPEGAVTFATQDLSGNVVTSELFLGKKLTVFNIWGTFCTPCINEMPELAEWSQNMPEGVQLVGLVSDLNTYEDAEILELAQMICETTGADVYTNLVANEDFTEMLSGVVGVPTTFFIDGNGVIVGDPVVGANVQACKAFVESYVAE